MKTKTMTMDDLVRILIDRAGESEDVDLRGDVADRKFTDLGYDSLALMDAAVAIEQEFGVRIPDQRIADMTTPGAVLALVNGAPPHAA